MKRVIGSSWFAAVAFAVTSLGLIAMLYQRVEPFRYYGRRSGVAPLLPDAGVTTVLLLAAAALATLSCLLGRADGAAADPSAGLVLRGDRRGGRLVAGRRLLREGSRVCGTGT